MPARMACGRWRDAGNGSGGHVDRGNLHRSCQHHSLSSLFSPVVTALERRHARVRRDLRAGTRVLHFKQREGLKVIGVY